MVAHKKRLEPKQAAVILNTSVDTESLYSYNEIREIIFRFLSKNTLVCQQIFNMMLKEQIFIKIGNNRKGVFYVPNKFPVFYKRIEHWYEEADKKVRAYQAPKPRLTELQILYKQKEEIDNKIKQYLVTHNLL